MVTSNYSVPSPVKATPYSKSNYLNDYYTDDVYTFEIDETSSINLNLHNITSGDDADLYLYQDDGDGVFEPMQDQELARSRRGGNADDSINYLAESGTYFARVERYAFGSQGRLDYELDLSATPDTPSPADDPTEAPNLLPMEVNVGDVFSSGPGPQNFSGWVGDTNTADTYAFSVPNLGFGIYLANISLTQLSNDADIRLIEDSNSNDIVDQGEVIGSSTNGGSLDESIVMGLDEGEYFLQVYQYDGDTSYQLTFA